MHLVSFLNVYVCVCWVWSRSYRGRVRPAGPRADSGPLALKLFACVLNQPIANAQRWARRWLARTGQLPPTVSHGEYLKKKKASRKSVHAERVKTPCRAVSPLWFMMEKHEDGHGVLYLTLCETKIRSLDHDSSLCVFIGMCVFVCQCVLGGGALWK